MDPLLDPDLLLLLFSFILPVAVALPPLQTDDHLRLTQVCGTWRNTLISHPVFWQNYTFFPWRSFKSREALVAALGALIGRSGIFPPSLYFHTDFFREQPDISSDLQVQCALPRAGKVNIIQDFVIPHISRLRFLTLFVSLGENSASLLDLLRKDLSGSTLEVIEITVLDNVNLHHISFTLRDIRPFHILPTLLLHVDQMQNGVHSIGLADSLPWFSMTRIHFGSTMIPHHLFVRIMLESREVLNEANFATIVDPTVEIPTRKPIVLPQLIRLHVKIINASSHPNLMELFCFPSLRDFWIKQAEPTFPFNWELPAFLSSLSHSEGQLESLRFEVLTLGGHQPTLIHDASSRWPSSSGQLRNLFEAAPRLKDLWLPYGARFDFFLLEGLATGEILPQLTTLHLAGNTDSRQLFDTIRRRNANADRSSPHFRNMSTLSALDATFPGTRGDEEKCIRGEAAALGLSGGCQVHFRGRCGGCGRCCFFDL